MGTITETNCFLASSLSDTFNENIENKPIASFKINLFFF